MTQIETPSFLVPDLLIVWLEDPHGTQDGNQQPGTG